MIDHSARPLPPPPVFLIGGPTASGKSALAERLAARFGLPIVGADTMQMYADLPIASAAPRLPGANPAIGLAGGSSTEPAPRSPIRVHLVGFLAPDETFSAGEYVRRVVPIARETAGAGRPAIVCGGTGLYLRALRVGLSAIPPIAPTIRERLLRDHAELGAAALHARLAAIDPPAAAATPAANRQRLLRALEVFEATGRPISAWWGADRDAPPPTDVRAWIVVDRNSQDLDERIRSRNAAMLEAGLLDEVMRFRDVCRAAGLDAATTPAARTLGIGDLIAAIDQLAGSVTAPGGSTPPAPLSLPRSAAEAPPSVLAALDRMRLTTRQYAKRQRTWLRKDAAAATWLDASRLSLDELEEAAASLLAPHVGHATA
jgi:tRNA dimethylallyltransferase